MGMDKPKRNYLSQGINYIRQKNVGFIISFISFVAGEVVGMKISPQIGATLVIIACALFVYLIVYPISNRLPTKWNRAIPKIILPILTAVLLFTLLFNSIVAFVTPSVAELPNSYIHQTINSAGTLLEFGVRRYETKLDIKVVTEDGYATIEDWWDSPGLTDRSSDAPCGICTVRSVNKYGVQILAKPIVISRDISSPIFEFNVYSPQITPSRSYYLRFNATEPVAIQAAVFGSVTVIGE